MKTRNENGTESGTNAEQVSAEECKVRGIRKLKPRLDRPKPFGVEWRVDGAPKTEWFVAEKERDKRYDTLVRERGKGTLARVLTKQEVTEWTAFKASIGEVDWRDVVAGWRAHNVQTTGFAAGSTLTVKDACKSYLEAQQKRHDAQKLAAGTLRQKVRKIGAFSDAFGANPMIAITAEEIANWIEDDLGFTNGDTFDSWIGHLGVSPITSKPASPGHFKTSHSGGRFLLGFGGPMTSLQRSAATAGARGARPSRRVCPPALAPCRG